MNTVEAKAAFSDISGVKAAKIIDIKQQVAEVRESSAEGQDVYSASNPGDKVAAKVLSFSINKRFESAFTERDPSFNSTKAKLDAVADAPLFDIQKVTENVIGFVSTAISDLALNGASTEQLAYYKKQAVEGVKYGVEQAKSELADIADEALMQNIDLSQKNILKGIDKISINPEEYIKAHEAKQGNSQAELYNQVAIETNSGNSATISFGQSVFNAVELDDSKSFMYTTQSSNLSFSIKGELAESEWQSIADIVNRADDLATSFYRKDIAQSYEKAIQLGFDDKELLSLAMQQGVKDKRGAMNAYGDIKHYNNDINIEDLSSPKAVANYVARLLNVMETSKQELASPKEYNEVINGLVNQMKDVQVPDLLQAINRFHEFNQKFTN